MKKKRIIRLCTFLMLLPAIMGCAENELNVTTMTGYETEVSEVTSDATEDKTSDTKTLAEDSISGGSLSEEDNASSNPAAEVIVAGDTLSDGEKQSEDKTTVAEQSSGTASEYGDSDKGLVTDYYIPLYVYVCGEVKNEGVYKLAPGDRVVDALDEAGGFSENAATGVVNLAELLYDGEKLYFPSKSEVEGLGEKQLNKLIYGSTSGDNSASNKSDSRGSISSSLNGIGGISGNSGSGNASVEKSDAGIVNINTADADTLMTLSGIGERKAQDIIAYRQEHGSFSSKEDIMNVSGIGQSTYDRISSQITVD